VETKLVAAASTQSVCHNHATITHFVTPAATSVRQQHSVHAVAGLRCRCRVKTGRLCEWLVAITHLCLRWQVH